MTTKLLRWRRITLMAAALSASMVSLAWGNAPLYQMHTNGSIWRYTGAPCSGGVCSGWQQLDNNRQAVQIAAGGGQLYQLHWDGSIWQFTGQPCNGSSCPGWALILTPFWGAGTQIIEAAQNTLVMEQFDGSLWQYNGQPCNGSSCPGWVKIDNNFDFDNYFVGDAGVLEQHVDGSIWQFTGQPCNGNWCGGWQQIDGNPNTSSVECNRPVLDCTMASGTSWMYELWKNGTVMQYTGPPCGIGCNGWRMVDNNPNTTQITAGSGLFKKHNDGSLWVFPGPPCNGNTCPGWYQIDNNPLTSWIVAGPDTVYQVHTSGSLWQYIGPTCYGGSCPGWVELDNNPETLLVVPGF